MTAANSPSAMPTRRLVLVPTEPDPQLSIHYWNHGCPRPGCTTWVPNHRRCCATHEEN